MTSLNHSSLSTYCFTFYCQFAAGFVSRAVTYNELWNYNLHITRQKKQSGPTETWTRIAGFRVQSANHCTMGPLEACVQLTASRQYVRSTAQFGWILNGGHALRKARLALHAQLQLSSGNDQLAHDQVMSEKGTECLYLNASVIPTPRLTSLGAQVGLGILGK